MYSILVVSFCFLLHLFLDSCSPKIPDGEKGKRRRPAPPTHPPLPVTLCPACAVLSTSVTWVFCRDGCLGAGSTLWVLGGSHGDLTSRSVPWKPGSPQESTTCLGSCHSCSPRPGTLCFLVSLSHVEINLHIYIYFCWYFEMLPTKVIFAFRCV